MQGDVRTVEPRRADYTHLIHGATPSDADLNERRPHEMLEIIETGTRRMLDVASRSRAQRFLLLSSGAVYQPPSPPGASRRARHAVRSGPTSARPITPASASPRI